MLFAMLSHSREMIERSVHTARVARKKSVPCSEGGVKEEAEKDADFTVPLRFRLSGSPNGKPDLQLQLLRLDFGADARGSHSQGCHRSKKLLTVPTAHGRRQQTPALLNHPSHP